MRFHISPQYPYSLFHFILSAPLAYLLKLTRSLHSPYITDGTYGEKGHAFPFQLALGVNVHMRVPMERSNLDPAVMTQWG